MWVEASKGAAPWHGRNSFRRSCAAGGGLVDGGSRCCVGASFSRGIASSRANFLLVALHEAHGQNLSHSTRGSEYTLSRRVPARKLHTLVDSVDAAASLNAGALASTAAWGRNMKIYNQKLAEGRACNTLHLSTFSQAQRMLACSHAPLAQTAPYLIGGRDTPSKLRPAVKN
jgi:hypothetical protein